MFDEETQTHRFPYMNNVVILERKDPFGFYHARLEHGMTPKELDGVWTHPDQVKVVVDTLIRNKKVKQ